jgi:hypothetical protein
LKENTEDKKYIQSVERALGMLSYVADHGSARLGEISEFAGLKTSTTFGLLQTLEHCGYLSRGRGDMEYSLGLASLKLGLCYNRSSGMAEKIHALLTELVKEIDETAYFEIRMGERYYYYDVVLSTQPLKVVPDDDCFIDLAGKLGGGKGVCQHRSRLPLRDRSGGCGGGAELFRRTVLRKRYTAGLCGAVRPQLSLYPRKNGARVEGVSIRTEKTGYGRLKVQEVLK